MKRILIPIVSSVGLLIAGVGLGHVLLAPGRLEAATPETAPVGFSVSSDRSTLYFTKAGKLYVYSGGELPNGSPGLTLQGSISLDAIGEPMVPVLLSPGGGGAESDVVPGRRKR